MTDKKYSDLRPFEAVQNLAEFLGEMSFSTFKDMGCDGVLLVEGVTEVKVIRHFLRLMRKEQRFVVLPLGGDQLIGPDRQHELAELQRLSTDVAVLIDSERDAEDASLSKERQTFLADCKALGFRTHATKLRATENYFTQAELDQALGPGKTALQPFQKLKDAKVGWGKSENWRVACAKALDSLMATDIGEFLSTL